jgi:hypothetical protein
MNPKFLEFPAQRLFTTRQQSHEHSSIHFQSVPIVPWRFREVVDHQTIDYTPQEVVRVFCYTVNEEHTRDQCEMG